VSGLLPTVGAGLQRSSKRREPRRRSDEEAGLHALETSFDLVAPHGDELADAMIEGAEAADLDAAA